MKVYSIENVFTNARIGKIIFWSKKKAVCKIRHMLRIIKTYLELALFIWVNRI